jgi:serine/threonine-protein kinase
MLEALGDYKILGPVGAGRLGEVYRARDTRLGRTVAVRVVSAGVAANPERREQLLGRARAVTALSHPNIAALYEIVEDAGRLFLVSEFVAGEPLGAIIGGRPLNPRRAIDLASQIADALAEAHAEGIVCGDLSTGSVVVTPKGNAKILDFGLSAFHSDVSRRPTDGKPSDYRQDISSVGAVLFEMLTGKPFSGASEAAALPGDLGPIVAKALGQDRNARYESAATLAAELRAAAAVLDVRATAAAPAAVPVAVTRAKRSSFGWIWLAAVVVALGVAAAWYFRM